MDVPWTPEGGKLVLLVVASFGLYFLVWLRATLREVDARSDGLWDIWRFGRPALVGTVVGAPLFAFSYLAYAAYVISLFFWSFACLLSLGYGCGAEPLPILPVELLLVGLVAGAIGGLAGLIGVTWALWRTWTAVSIEEWKRRVDRPLRRKVMVPVYVATLVLLVAFPLAGLALLGVVAERTRHHVEQAWPADRVDAVSGGRRTGERRASGPEGA